MSDYKNLKVVELKGIARSRGLRGWSRLRKAELISFIMSEEQRQREEEELERQRQRDLLRLKDERKSKSKARRQAKREEAKREAERRTEVRKIESNQRKQRQENITGERPIGKETKSQRKRRQRLERQAEEAEKKSKSQRKKNPKKARKEAKRRHRATKKEARRRLNTLRQRRLTEPARTTLRRKFRGGRSTLWFVDGSEYLDPEVFLHDVANGVRETVDGVSGPKKVHMNLSCILEKEDVRTGNKMEDTFGARSNTRTITLQLGDTYDEMRDRMIENLSKFQRNGSGWRLKSIHGLEISITRYDPLSGSGYSKLPPYIAKKNIVINMRNEDNQCFKWAVTRALNPVNKNPNRITNELKEQTEKYNWEDISFPTKVKEIKIWEENNNVSVNVFSYDEDERGIYTIRIGELKDPSETINLYLHDDNHYCVIKDLNRLVSSQLSKSDHGKDICLRCLNAFGRLTKKEREDPEKKSLLEKHMEICSGQKLQHAAYPRPGDTVRFRNYERLHDVPFSVYADFESFVKPLETEDKNPNESYTVKYQSHVPSGFCYTIKCMDESVYPTKTVLKTASYEGEDMGKLFVETLTEDIKPIYEILKNPKPMVISESDKTTYEESENCYACGIQFRGERINERTKKKEKIVKCRDHCHITGKYRGAACDKCNLRMKVPKFVPVLFHNLEGYDAHLFVKSLVFLRRTKSTLVLVRKSLWRLSCRKMVRKKRYVWK